MHAGLPKRYFCNTETYLGISLRCLASKACWMRLDVANNHAQYQLVSKTETARLSVASLSSDPCQTTISDSRYNKHTAPQSTLTSPPRTRPRPRSRPIRIPLHIRRTKLMTLIIRRILKPRKILLIAHIANIQITQIGIRPNRPRRGIPQASR